MMISDEGAGSPWRLSSLTLDSDTTAGVTLRSISAQRFLRRSSATDLDGSPYRIIDFPSITVKDRTFSHELQLLGNALDNRVKWIVGAFG
jgi:iron complex outermembrane receptor protein